MNTRDCVVSLYHTGKPLAYIRSGRHYTTLSTVPFNIVAYNETLLKDNCNFLKRTVFNGHTRTDSLSNTRLTTDFLRTRFVHVKDFDQ